MKAVGPAEQLRAAKLFVAAIDAFGLGVLALGLIVRIATYLQRRSLWYDEAMLSLNILGRSIWRLTDPLAYNQAAPIGFLWSTRLVTGIVGPSELALRATAVGPPFRTIRKNGGDRTLQPCQ